MDKVFIPSHTVPCAVIIFSTSSSTWRSRDELSWYESDVTHCLQYVVLQIQSIYKLGPTHVKYCNSFTFLEITSLFHQNALFHPISKQGNYCPNACLKLTYKVCTTSMLNQFPSDHSITNNTLTTEYAAGKK